MLNVRYRAVCLTNYICKSTGERNRVSICRHNDLPWNVRKFVHNQLGEVNLSSDLGRVDPWARSDWSHTDIPRLRAGLVGAQVNLTWHSLASPPLLPADRYSRPAFSPKAYFSLRHFSTAGFQFLS